MPHHKSTAKRMRTSEKQRVKNVEHRSRLRTAVKKAQQTTDPEAGAVALRNAFSELDRGAKTGLIKRNTANRTKSRLTRQQNSQTA